MAMIAFLTDEERKARQRESKARYSAAFKSMPHATSETQQPPPPRYVLREREIRRQIPPASFTAKTFGDPLPGYSGADNMKRKLSVQDALEICALYNGKYGEMFALSKAYGVSHATISTIISGEWFDRLLPGKEEDEADTNS